MYRQMTLWCEEEALASETNIWRNIDPKMQHTFIITLARLINKALFPQTPFETQEADHECK